jgi:hypothetical protein
MKKECFDAKEVNDVSRWNSACGAGLMRMDFGADTKIQAETGTSVMHGCRHIHNMSNLLEILSYTLRRKEMLNCSLMRDGRLCAGSAAGGG